MLLELPGGGSWAVEIKLGSIPKCENGFYHALEDVRPARAFVVYSGEERYPLTPDIEAISLEDLARDLAALP